ncbi:MAG: L-seryl-tRNA(Sec) selenium transferase [Gemmatimonadota bacterium]|nr:L-seryl-tRNA(Sec) selenium transferase [Gemmatimonadota bacterium]
MTDPRRALPAVGTVLEGSQVQACAAHWTPAMVTDAVRALLTAARGGAAVPVDDAAWAAAVTRHLEARTRASLRPVLNATGVVLHTNLGRAPLAPAALEAMAAVARGGSTLEYDVAAGARGDRHGHATALLRELTGAEDALVVNNCAAGLVLALQALAAGRETLVSRGELVEIGGSFRVPEIMAASGTTLVEIGTTNRTHAADYARALGPRTAAIVKVHRSNFALEGFVAEATIPELAPIAAGAGLPLIHDFGSGLLLDLSPWGLTGEPTAGDAVRDGATLVIMSGDKLLGGPQAGIVLGTRAAIETLRRHPMARALRVDKLTFAALEATLALYRDPTRARAEIPALAMLTATTDAIRQRATAVAAALGPAASVVASEASVGGGAFPTARIPSAAVILGGEAMAIERRLRGGRLPVIARIADDRVRLDLRSLPPEDDATLVALVREALA